MSIDEEIISLFSELLGVEKKDITPEKNIVDDLGADSLDLPEIIMVLEERYSCTIPKDAATQIKTVGDAIEYIKKHK